MRSTSTQEQAPPSPDTAGARVALPERLTPDKREALDSLMNLVADARTRYINKALKKLKIEERKFLTPAIATALLPSDTISGLHRVRTTYAEFNERGEMVRERQPGYTDIIEVTQIDPEETENENETTGARYKGVFQRLPESGSEEGVVAYFEIGHDLWDVKGGGNNRIATAEELTAVFKFFEGKEVVIGNTEVVPAQETAIQTIPDIFKG